MSIDGTTTRSATAAGNGRATRAERIREIVDAAHVRQHLGQGVLYCRLADGQHVVIFRGERFVGATVDAAIAAAREGNTE
ncbi:MAG: hypothetical protein ABIP48_22855 [Planctomycetota bacterium]